MSFKPEVIADSSGQWCGNALRFATREEAEANVRDLMMRWLAVRETRIVVSDDPVNYRYVDGRLENLTSEAAAPAQSTEAAPAASYRELLDPVPNALAALMTDEAQHAKARATGETQLAYHHHHHHC